MSALSVAVAAYPVDFLGSWERYAAKLEHWVKQAADAGARLLVFPEYAAMELVSLEPDYATLSLTTQLQRVAARLDAYRELHSALAKRFKVHLIAGSLPVAVGDGFRNRAYLFTPDGNSDFQEKLQMTRFETETWGVSAGTDLKVFDTALGRLAINICYDSEFPLLARQQVEQGADIIVVPSCTDTLAGYHRVRIGSQARALENQCYVLQAPLVGDADWSEAVDINIGAAAVYSPVDRGFAPDGIVAESVMNEAGWLYASLDPEAIAAVRADGQVFNYRDWDGQLRAQLTTVRLR